MLSNPNQSIPIISKTPKFIYIHYCASPTHAPTHTIRFYVIFVVSMLMLYYNMMWYCVLAAFNSEKYESQLGRSFDPYVSAARQVILTSGYAILIVVAAMLVIHIGGAVLFHFLKTRHKFPVRRVFISSSPPSAPRGIQNPVHGGEESEYDSDDHDGARGGHYATYATPTRVRMSPQKTNTLTTDFKYSETKV